MKATRQSLGYLVFFACAAFLLPPLLGCGKKGAPTLRLYDKPEAPSSLTAIHREDSIVIRWDYPKSRESQIAEFIVLRSSGHEYEKLSHVEKDKREYRDRNFTNNSRYEYKVISQNLRGVYSEDSNTVSVSPSEVPPPPKDLTYRVEGSSLVVSWDHTKGSLYNIYKRTGKGAYGLRPENSSPLTEPVFRDSFSVNSVAYYTVRRLKDSAVRNEGPASAELAADPADLVPSKPENFEAYAAADRVFLYWHEFDEIWVTGFRVYRKMGDGDYALIGRTQIPTFLDPEAPATKRSYRVTAVGPAKEGPAAEIRDVMHIPQR